MSDRQLAELKRLHNTIKGQIDTQRTVIIELNDLCREILKWIKLSNVGIIKVIRETVLNTDEKRLAYHMTDGINTARAIAKVIPFNHTTVTDWWKDWYMWKIAVPIPVQRGDRGKKVFDLEDFGISEPNIPLKPQRQEEAEKLEEGKEE